MMVLDDDKHSSSISLSIDTRDKIRILAGIRGVTYNKLIKDKFKDDFKYLEQISIPEE